MRASTAIWRKQFADITITIAIVVVAFDASTMYTAIMDDSMNFMQLVLARIKLAWRSALLISISSP